MKFRQVKEADKYKCSQLLKTFETSFTYPLGAQRFTIRHGENENSYFDFFESLGKRHTLIVSKEDNILGVGCAVLRTVENSKKQCFWYLCDFKLAYSIRGKKILLLMLIKYFLGFYIRNQNMLVINMSSLKNNSLISKVERYFFFLKLDVARFFFMNGL